MKSPVFIVSEVFLDRPISGKQTPEDARRDYVQQQMNRYIQSKREARE